MKIRDFLSFKGAVSRKYFLIYCLPVMVAVEYCLMWVMNKAWYGLAMYTQRIIDSEGKFPLFSYEEVSYMSVMLFCIISVIYVKLCCIVKRLRDEKLPVWSAFLMFLADLFIFPYIWLPLCCLKGKNEKSNETP